MSTRTFAIAIVFFLIVMALLATSDGRKCTTDLDCVTYCRARRIAVFPGRLDQLEAAMRHPLKDQLLSPGPRLYHARLMMVALTQASKHARWAGAVQTLAHIQRALASAKGAVRHAEDRASRKARRG